MQESISMEVDIDPNDEEMSTFDGLYSDLERFGLSTSCEKILKDLKLKLQSPHSANRSEIKNLILRELHSSHLSRGIFRQNCTNYDSNIIVDFIQMINDKDLIKEMLNIKCLEKIVNEDPVFMISKLKKQSREDFIQICHDSNVIFGKIMIEFRKDPYSFSHVLNEKICNHAVSSFSISFNSPKQMIACLLRFPMKNKFLHALLKFKNILPADLYPLINNNNNDENEFSLHLNSFLNASFDSIQDGLANNLIKILGNWKKFTKFIIGQGWQGHDLDSILSHLQPAYSLISTIFYKKHKYKDFEMIRKFKRFHQPKIEFIQKNLKIIIELINSSIRKDYQFIKSGDDLIEFMKPGLSVSPFKELLLKSLDNSKDPEFVNDLLVSIAKFNPKNFNQFLQIAKSRARIFPSNLLDRFIENIPNFLDYPIENNVLIYHMSLISMQKYFSINANDSNDSNDNQIEMEKSMKRIFKFINYLDSMPFPEANMLTTLNLLLAVNLNVDSNWNENLKNRINFLFYEWNKKSQNPSYIQINLKLLELLKRDSKFNWILPLAFNSQFNDLDPWFKIKSRQLKTLLVPWNNPTDPHDSRNGKIVPDSSLDLLLYLESPKELSTSFYLDKDQIRILKARLSNYNNFSIPSDHILKSLLYRQNVYLFTVYDERDHIATYMTASKINKEQNLYLIHQNDILIFINKFMTCFDSREHFRIQFRFKDGEIGDGPSGEYLHAILKSIFIHSDMFGIVNDDDGIRLPAPMIHPGLMKVLGTIVGQLIVCFNIIPSVSFDDCILKHVHGLSIENLEAIWREYSDKNASIRGLFNMLNNEIEIKDFIFNMPQDKLILTNLKFDQSINSLRLDQSNWKEMMDGGDSFPSFSNNMEARKFLEERIELIKNNFFDGLKAFKRELNFYLDLEMLKNQGKSLVDLFPSKIPSREEFIERLELLESLSTIMITSSKIDEGDGRRIPVQISLKQGLIDFLRELKDDDYKKLLSKWITSPYIANLNNLKPVVDLKMQMDQGQSPHCISMESIRFLERFGYPLMNPPSIPHSSSSCNRDTYLITHTCSFQLSLVPYKTIDELRAGLLILAHSDEAHRARD